jgi:hypothetical protein
MAGTLEGERVSSEHQDSCLTNRIWTGPSSGNSYVLALHYRRERIIR